MTAPAADAIIVAGPTCSGKSSLALNLARRLGGVVINADSMQVYQHLRILTARPSRADMAEAPHFLYGVLPPAQTGSVAWWRHQVLAVLEECRRKNLLPIFCGGTGMYLRALTNGLVEIPDPGEEARNEARRLVAETGPQALHARLMMHDPQTASRLKPNDSQRIARAWEVWAGTGCGLAAWQERKNLPPAPCHFLSVRLDPPRPILRQAIAERFGAMIQQGALEEVAALLAQNLSPDLPVMRAHGVPELAAVLRGERPLEEAMDAAILATGRYTRRQATWFRHHPLAEEDRSMILLQRYVINEQFSEREMENIENFITNRIDLTRQAR